MAIKLYILAFHRLCKTTHKRVLSYGEVVQRERRRDECQTRLLAVVRQIDPAA